MRTVIAFEGPIGVGKTTLGKAVAERLNAGFLDGDDYSEAGPWIRSILRTSRRVVSACEERLESHDKVIVAYPLRCIDWLYYKGTFGRKGIRFVCVSLTAGLPNILTRERRLTEDEAERASQMLIQGYGRRSFSDLIFHTDQADFAVTRDRLAGEVQRLLGA